MTTLVTRLAVWLCLSLAVLSVAACTADSDAGDAGTEEFNPDLFGQDQMVPAAQVYEAVQSGENVVILDARPELDYEFGHIPGALNIPYFEASNPEATAGLSKDQWIVTYCECPHAEAVQLADGLTAQGFEHVRVIDEGLQGWRDAGGTTVGGTEPDES